MKISSEHAEAKTNQARFWVPPALKKEIEGLFQQQMWVWGQDICASQGNLLKEYGFSYRSGTDFAAFHGDKGHHSSAYALDRLTLQGKFRLELWSFGICLNYGTLHLFTGRARLRWYRLQSAVPPHFSRIKLLPAKEPLAGWLAAERVEEAYLTLAVWAEILGAYEDWIKQEQGLRWRLACLKKRPLRSPVKAEQMAESWQTIALKLQKLNS